MPRAQRRETHRSTRTLLPAPSISGAGETNVGHGRSENQDVIVVEPDLGLYAVFDGLGGGDAGDVAARVAADSIVASVRGRIFIPQLSPRKLIMRALRVASLDVRLASEEARSSLGMGTTAVVCLIVSPTLAVIGHIGDSRAYLLRDGKLKALTRDHTPVQELIDMGDLTVRGAKRHPKRHALFRYLGVPRGDFPDVMEQPLKPGDRLLLCSDGLHGYTSESSIRASWRPEADRSSSRSGSWGWRCGARRRTTSRRWWSVRSASLRLAALDVDVWHHGADRGRRDERAPILEPRWPPAASARGVRGT